MSSPDASPRFSLVACLVVLIGAGTAIFLCGGAEEGAQGIFLGLAGLAMIFCAPQLRVEKNLWFLLALLLLCGASAFLPAAWFPTPPWREQLRGLPIPLGAQITPMPAESLFYLGILAVTGLLFLFLLSHPLRARTRLLLAVCGVFIGGIYAGLSIYATETGWSYPFDGDTTFGFFPNRNHAASFLATSCLLALGILGVSIRQRKWPQTIFAILSFGGCGAALLAYSESRGGVLFLIAGTLLWLVGLGRRHWSKPLLISFVTIFAAGMVFFYVSKSEARNRMVKEIQNRTGSPMVEEARAEDEEKAASTERAVTVDGRVAIFKDTWRMMCDAPLTGVGLGAYKYLFLFYQKDSLTEYRSVHPESDWLMVAAEMGFPAVGILLLSLGMLLWQLKHHRDHPYWPLRWGVVCAALMAMLHGLVDVPMHRMALGWWILLFFAIGIHPSPANALHPPFWQRLLFMIAGGGALTMGFFLVKAEWFHGRFSPPYGAHQAEVKILGLFHENKLEEALQLSAMAIARHPLSERLYDQQAILLLQLDGREIEADRLFAAQRALYPGSPKIAIEQGEAWIGLDTMRTARLWLEGIERMKKIDATSGVKSGRTQQIYAHLIGQATAYPEIQASLRQAAGKDPALLLVWLRGVHPDLAKEEIRQIVADPALLSAFQGDVLTAFARVWYERGDRPALFALAEKNPAWAGIIWPLKVRQMLEAKQYREAVEAVLQKYKLDLSLPTLGADKKFFYPENNDEPLKNFELFWKAGNEASATRLMEEERLKSERDGAQAPEIWKISASLAVRAGEWERAWTFLQKYLQQTGVEIFP